MRRRLSLLALAGAAICAAPAFAQTPQIDPKAAADRLLDALRSAPDEAAAAMIEAHVEELWLRSGTPAVRLLVGRGFHDLQAGANEDAFSDFDAALALDDTLPEAWRARAQARRAKGDTAGAIADLAEALKREPREFMAYRALADIAVQQQNWKAALDAWQKLLAIDPKTPGGEARLKELRRRALGEEAAIAGASRRV